MDIIKKYFQNLTEKQEKQFSMLYDLYKDWNSKINVISRKDIDALYEHHVLHSLAIAKVVRFTAGTQVLDVGTGGGFPGIPLAILFPDVKFHLVDSIAKKIKVVAEISKALGLDNITSQQIRSTELKRKFDFIVSRAVTNLPKFVEETKHCIHHNEKNGLPNGIIYLKGGDLEAEIQPFRKTIMEESISDFFEEEFFEEKYVLFLPL